MTPTLMDGITDAVRVEGGATHFCALRETRTVACWGLNENGELGTGTVGSPMSSDVPLTVPLIADAIDVDAGFGFTCVLRESDGVSCWGSNYFGALGTALPAGDADRATPAVVEAAPGGIVDIDSLYLATCATNATGSVWCWGPDIVEAAMSKAASSENRSATQITGLGGALDVSVGALHACAVLRDGSVACWGRSLFGELGDGTTDGSMLPVQVMDLP
jgi:hypothetical protein